MNGWIILLIVLLALWLLSLLRLGARIHYGRDDLRVTLIAGPARIQVLPARMKEKHRRAKKQKKPKKEKKKKQAKPEDAEKPGTAGRLMKLLPVAAEAAGKLLHKIRIDELSLDITWGAPDAASAAIGYGRANALLGMIWPLFDHNFKVKKHSFRVDVDYDLTEPNIILDAALTMTIGQLLAFGLHYGIKALITWSRAGNARKDDRRQNYERK